MLQQACAYILQYIYYNHIYYNHNASYITIIMCIYSNHKAFNRPVRPRSGSVEACAAARHSVCDWGVARFVRDHEAHDRCKDKHTMRC